MTDYRWGASFDENIPFIQLLHIRVICPKKNKKKITSKLYSWLMPNRIGISLSISLKCMSSLQCFSTRENNFVTSCLLL